MEPATTVLSPIPSKPHTLPSMAEPRNSDEDAYLRRLGVMVQLIRKRLLGVNQTELGEAVHRDKTTISRWENGHTSLSAHDLSQLWAALDVPAEWVLDPTDSIDELDRRVVQLEHRQRLLAAEEAALAEEGAPGPSTDAGAGVQPRRRSA